MSIRDQLLKAGLVSQDKARQAEVEARKQTHQTKKDKGMAAAEATRRAEERQRLEAEAERKRERDRQLNREREAHKKQKENAARVRQLIESHRLNDPNADIPYYLSIDGRRIRPVRVTQAQRKLLARGRLGVARNQDDEYDFPLLPRETALKVAEIDPQGLLLLHPESDGSAPEDAD